jgi:hypothetical protein
MWPHNFGMLTQEGSQSGSTTINVENHPGMEALNVKAQPNAGRGKSLRTSRYRERPSESG